MYANKAYYERLVLEHLKVFVDFPIFREFYCYTMVRRPMIRKYEWLRTVCACVMRRTWERVKINAKWRHSSRVRVHVREAGCLSSVHCQPAMSDCRWRVGLLGLCLICVGPLAGAAPRADLFTNSFLVRFRRNVDQKLAGQVAERNGFVNLGPVSFNSFATALTSLTRQRH